MNTLGLERRIYPSLLCLNNKIPSLLKCKIISTVFPLTPLSLHFNSQAGGGGHLRKETSPADSGGGPGRCGEMGFSWTQETPFECGSGRRQPSQPFLRTE